ncbi:hypothetical protein COO60DRAFT_321223 [Scenedesmus sp. NREL 46B-D3]|nr:hypothetical protein COO60DRAFT_321223 [Scenedesmus sp. NREL 46B-D3]
MCYFTPWTCKWLAKRSKTRQRGLHWWRVAAVMMRVLGRSRSCQGMPGGSPSGVKGRGLDDGVYHLCRDSPPGSADGVQPGKHCTLCSRLQALPPLTATTKAKHAHAQGCSKLGKVYMSSVCRGCQVRRGVASTNRRCAVQLNNIKTHACVLHASAVCSHMLVMPGTPLDHFLAVLWLSKQSNLAGQHHHSQMPLTSQPIQ